MATEKSLSGDVSWANVANTGGRRTAHEFVKDSLRRAILRGDLSGGSRLIQADLATMLNVSTTPVREALRDLATEGLITLDRHRGGVVRELNWQEMEEIRLIRHQLEPLAVRLVVEHITDAELEEAERLRERMAKERDLGDWVELNTQFHLVFHDSTGVQPPRRDPQGLRGGIRRLRGAGPAMAPGDPKAGRRRASGADRGVPSP